jgi:tetratricopeptide (TPR) repeat protein
MLGLAEVFVKEERNEEAEVQLKTALLLEPDNSEVHRVWGKFLNSNERFSEAETAFKKSIELKPDAFRSLVSLGNLYLVDMDRPEDAIITYRTALVIESDYVGLGNALAVTGKFSEAEIEFQEAGRLAPGNPLPFYTLGELYVVSDKPDMALNAFAMALKAQPNFVQAHMERGDLYFLKGDDDKAFDEYRAALKISPTFAVAQVKIGMIYESNKDVAKAESSYLAALEIDPTQVIAYNNLAWLAAEKGTNLDNALTWAKKANDIVSNPEFKDTLGWVYRARGELDLAMAVLENAVAVDPGNAGILYHLGVIYKEKGMIKEAVEVLEGALSLGNNFSQAEDAKRMLELLE